MESPFKSVRALIDFVLKERTDAADWKDDSSQFIKLANAADKELSPMEGYIQTVATLEPNGQYAEVLRGVGPRSLEHRLTPEIAKRVEEAGGVLAKPAQPLTRDFEFGRGKK